MAVCAEAERKKKECVGDRDAGESERRRGVEGGGVQSGDEL